MTDIHAILGRRDDLDGVKFVIFDGGSDAFGAFFRRSAALEMPAFARKKIQSACMMTAEFMIDCIPARDLCPLRAGSPAPLHPHHAAAEVHLQRRLRPAHYDVGREAVNETPSVLRIFLGDHKLCRQREQQTAADSAIEPPETPLPQPQSHTSAARQITGCRHDEHHHSSDRDERNIDRHSDREQ